MDEYRCLNLSGFSYLLEVGHFIRPDTNILKKDINTGTRIELDGMASIQPTISLEMPVPSQRHYGFHSFPVVDLFCLFIYL
jgi:hypothetical protein